MKKKDAQKGKGVSREAQELFDFISRTYVSPFPLSYPSSLPYTIHHPLTQRSTPLTLPPQPPHPLGRRPNRRQRRRPHPAALHTRRDPRARRQRAEPGARAQGRRALLPAPKDSRCGPRNKEGGLGHARCIRGEERERESEVRSHKTKVPLNTSASAVQDVLMHVHMWNEGREGEHSREWKRRRGQRVDGYLQARIIRKNQNLNLHPPCFYRLIKGRLHTDGTDRNRAAESGRRGGERVGIQVLHQGEKMVTRNGELESMSSVSSRRTRDDI
jgi:hypothetical protein